MSKITKLFILFALIYTTACRFEPFVPEFPAGTVEGYKPIYVTDEQKDIELLASRSLQQPGKIYVYQHYLFINEKLRGIHIYNNANPTSPEPVGFLQVAGSTDIAIRNNVLYVNHLGDLVGIKFEDWDNLIELSRIPQPYWDVLVPPVSNVYFECPNQASGFVVGWELATLQNPKCYQ